MITLIFTCTFSELFMLMKIRGFPLTRLIMVLLLLSPVVCLPSLSLGTSVMKTFEPPKPGHFIRWVCRELVLAPVRSVYFSVSMLFSWLPVWLWLNILPVKWWWSFLALKKVRVLERRWLPLTDASGREKGMYFLQRWLISGELKLTESVDF